MLIIEKRTVIKDKYAFLPNLPLLTGYPVLCKVYLIWDKPNTYRKVLSL